MLTLMRKAQAIWSDESGAAAPPAVDRPAPSQPASPRRPKIGLALGAGAARGWTHIGILRELDAAGFRPDIIAGTSIGALIGGCYAAGQLDAIEDFALSLTRRRVVSLLDLSFSGGGLFSAQFQRVPRSVVSLSMSAGAVADTVLMRACAVAGMGITNSTLRSRALPVWSTLSHAVT